MKVFADYKGYHIARNLYIENVCKNDMRFEEYWNMDENSSYMRIIQKSIFADLRLPKNPISTNENKEPHYKAAILEIGYGKQLRGIDLMINKYRLDPKYITGVEADEEIHNNAVSKFKDSNFYLVQYDPEDLENRLKEFSANNIRFNLIICRHVMQGFPNYKNLLTIISSLLKESYRGIARSAYVQVTRSKRGPNDTSFPDLIEKDLTWKTYGGNHIWDGDTWCRIVEDSGMHVYDAGRWYAPTQRLGYENYLFARRV